MRPVPTYVKQAGAWSALNFTGVKFKQAGAWGVGAALYVKDAGIWKPSWAANAPPPDPTSVAAVALNGGGATVSWVWPGNAENDYDRVRVEQQVNGGAWGSMQETLYSAQTQSRTGLTHGYTYKYRVATRDTAGLLSNWVESNTISAINTGPAGASITNVTWDSGGDRFQVFWTDPGNPYSDITDVDLYAKHSAESYVKISDFGYAGGARSAYVSRRAWDNLHSFFVRVISPGGTTDSNVWQAWSPPQPGTVKTITPQGSDTWTQAQGWRNTAYLFQGRWDETYEKQAGYLFYGTQLADACHGFTPSVVSITMRRYGSFGESGKLDYYFHGYLSEPAGSPGLITGSYWPSWNTYFGDDEWEDPIPSSNYGAIVSGAYRGIALWKDSTNVYYYRHMYGPSNYANAGKIKISF